MSDPPSLQEVNIDPKWFQKRKKTTIVFVLETVCLGMEDSAFTATIWLYVTTLINTSDQKLLYSLIAAAFHVSAILAAPVIGKLADKHRCPKKLLLLTNTLTILGNLLYLYHFSPYCVVIGRLLAGPSDVLRSVMAGEVARSYHESELCNQFSRLGIAFILGFVLGPALNAAFVKVDFYVGAIHITAANAPGIFVSIFFIILQVLIVCFVHDLSKEFNLKAVHEDINANQHHKAYGAVNYNEKEEKLQFMFTSLHLKGKLKFVTRYVLQNTHFLVVFWLSLLSQYAIVTFNVWLPMLLLNEVKWNALELNLTIFAVALLTGASLFVFGMLNLTRKGLHQIIMTGMLISVTFPITFYFVKIYPLQMSVVIPLLCVWGFSFAISCAAQELYLVTIVAMMVESSKQAFVDSIRLSFSRVGGLLSLLTTVYLFQKMLSFIIAICLLWLVTLFLFLLQFKNWFRTYEKLVTVL